MDYGFTDADGFRPPQNITLGSSFLDRATLPPEPKNISDDELLRRFVALVERSPEFGWRAGKALGEQAFTIPPERPDPMPVRGVVAIEATFGDRGPSKAKRQRADRDSARYDVTIQVSTTKDRGVSSPSFRGRADLYTPQRARIKIEELSKATKCRTPFSAAYKEFAEMIIEMMALPKDMLVGFLHSKPRTGGTFYHDRQMVLIPRSELESGRIERAMIVIGEEARVVSFQLPPTSTTTSTTTSTGKPLSSKFVAQSRGQIRAGHFSNSWATGQFVMRK